MSTEITLHHKYSPSSMKYRAICPGFFQDQSGDTTKADIGTLQHKAFETGDLSILPDEATKGAVQSCLDIARKLEADADEIHKEVRLPVLGGLSFGTADEVILHHKKRIANVIDEKYGLHLVDHPSTNWQGWCYASAVFDRWSVDHVRVWFLMPYLDKVLHHTFSRADMKAINARISEVISRAEVFNRTQNPAMLNATPEGCVYCGRKATCPKMIGFALATAKKYAPLEVVEEVHSSLVTNESQMLRLVEASKVLTKMLDSVNEHAKRMAIEHGGLHDASGKLVYELAEKQGARKVKPDRVADLVDALLAAGLTEREILACSDVSLSQAIDLVGEKAPRGQKGKLRGALEAKLDAEEIVGRAEPSRYLKKVRENA